MTNVQAAPKAAQTFPTSTQATMRATATQQRREAANTGAVERIASLVATEFTAALDHARPGELTHDPQFKSFTLTLLLNEETIARDAGPELRAAYHSYTDGAGPPDAPPSDERLYLDVCKRLFIQAQDGIEGALKRDGYSDVEVHRGQGELRVSVTFPDGGAR